MEGKLQELIERVEKLERTLMQTKADLDAAIAALPGQIVEAVTPLIQSGQTDFTSEVAALQAIPGQVAAALTPTTTTTTTSTTPQ